MVYGFCYTRVSKSGDMYKSCPRYKGKLKGFGKFTDKVASKIAKSGRPDYSKKNRKFEKNKKRNHH